MILFLIWISGMICLYAFGNDGGAMPFIAPMILMALWSFSFIIFIAARVIFKLI